MKQGQSGVRLEDQARNVRRLIMEMAGLADKSHAVAALSEVDILVALYGSVMRHDPSNPQWPERDRFILSKGHGAEGLYATLAWAGYYDPSELQTYKRYGSKFAGHPNRLAVPGVEASTGALGHGLSLGVGMALAARFAARPYRVFVLMGDGELNEGQVWEAAMTAAHFRVDNLVGIVDRNGLQNDGACGSILGNEPLEDKWRSFGWECRTVDGHDVQALSKTMASVPFRPGKPSMVLANTIKGRGVSFLENRYELHYAAYSSEQVARALAEISGGSQEGVAR
jgi:transketolase